MTCCLSCGEPVETTEVGTVEVRRNEFVGFSSPPIDAIVHTRYGTVNRPCGCVDGGLRFDLTDGAT